MDKLDSRFAERCTSLRTQSVVRMVWTSPKNQDVVQLSLSTFHGSKWNAHRQRTGGSRLPSVPSTHPTHPCLHQTKSILINQNGSSLLRSPTTSPRLCAGRCLIRWTSREMVSRAGGGSLVTRSWLMPVFCLQQDTSCNCLLCQASTSCQEGEMKAASRRQKKGSCALLCNFWFLATYGVECTRRTHVFQIKGARTISNSSVRLSVRVSPSFPGVWQLKRGHLPHRACGWKRE